MPRVKSQVVVDTRAFEKGMEAELARLGLLCQEDAMKFAESIRDRWRHLVPMGDEPGNPIADAVEIRHGRDSKGPYIDVGVFHGAGGTTEGEASPAEAAPPLEFGHWNKLTKSHVAPRPAARPGIAQAIAALPKEVK